MQSPTSWASVVAHGITDKTNDGGLTEVIPPVTNMTNGSGTTKKHTARKNRSGSKKSSTAKNINNSNSSYNNSNNNNNLVVDSQQFVEEPMIKPIEQPKMVPTFQSTPIPIQNANDGILQNYQTIEGPTHLNRPAQTYQPKQRKQSIPKYKRKLFKKRVKSLAVNLDGDPEEILRSGNGQLPESVSQIQFLGPPTDFLMEMEQKEKVLVQTQQLAPQADYQQANAHEDSSIYNDLNLSQLNTSPITNLNTTPDGGLTDVNPYLDAQPQMGNIMPIYYPTPPYIPMQMPIEVPMEMPIEVPMEMPMEVPMKMPMEVPMEMPMEVPMEVPMEMPVPLQHSSPNPQPTQTILEIDDHPFGTTTCSSNGTISSSPKTSGREYLMNNEFFALFPSPDLTEELNLDFLNEEFKELEMEIRAIFDNGAPPKSDNCGAEDNASERCEHIYSISPRQFDDDYSTCSNNDKTYWSDYEQPIEYPPLAISSQLWDPLGPNRRFSDPSNMMPPPPPGFEHLEPSYDCSSLMPYASYFGGKRSLSTRSRNLMGEQVPIVPHIDYPTPVPMNSQQRDLCEHQHFIGAFDTNLKCQLAELTVTNGSTGDGYYVCPELALLPELMDSEDETEVKSNYSYNELLERGKKPKHHSIGSHKFSSFPLEYNEEEKGGYGAEGMGLFPPNPITMPLISSQPKGETHTKVDSISEENIAYWNLLETIKKRNEEKQRQELHQSLLAAQTLMGPTVYQFQGNNPMVSQTNLTYWQLLERINELRKQNEQTEAFLMAQQNAMLNNQNFILNNGPTQMQQSYTGEPVGLVAELLQLTQHHGMMANGYGLLGGAPNGGSVYQTPNSGDIGLHPQITLDDKRVYNESEIRWDLMKWGNDQHNTLNPDQDQNDCTDPSMVFGHN